MARTLFRKQNVSFHLRFGLYLLGCLLLVIFSSTQWQLPVRQAFTSSLWPILQINYYGRYYSDLIQNYFVDHAKHIERINQLRADKLELRAQVQRLQHFRDETQHLRALLNYHQSHDIGQQMAYAINADQQSHYFWIDQGAQENVSQKMLVFAGQGVIGTVHRVFAHTSEVMALSHVKNAMPLLDTRSQLNTIAVGHGKDSTMRLLHVPKTADVQVGDVLVTSGNGGEYPAGLQVAKVSSITEKPGLDFVKVKVKLLVNPANAWQVLLISNQEES